MTMTVEQITFTTDGAGAADVVSKRPVTGRVVEVRVPNAGTTWMGNGATADFTLTRNEDGGTVLALTNGSAPFSYHPSVGLHTTVAGTSAYATGVGPVLEHGVPCDGHIRCVVAQAQFSKAGTVHVYVET